MAQLVERRAVESQDNELEILQPETKTVKVAGTEIEVRPFTFGKLLKALKYIQNLTSLLTEDETEFGENILREFASHGDDIIGLIHLSTDIPRDNFDLIPADEGLDLAVAVYEVNKDFFVQHLLPKIKTLLPSELLSETESEVETQPKKKAKAGSQSSKS